MDRSVLLVTTRFPPTGGVASIRMTKFAKYLPQNGWHPIVLTCNRDLRQVDCIDWSLFKSLPPSVTLRSSTFFNGQMLYRLLGGTAKYGSFSLSTNRIYTIYRSFLVPDAYVGWFPTAVVTALRLFSQYRYKVIISSSPGETSHLVGLVASAVIGCQFIADFRDPWIGRVNRPMRPRLFDECELMLERLVVRSCDLITVAWPGIGRELKSRHRTRKNSISLITNGYDEEDFMAAKPRRIAPITLLFSGDLWGKLSPSPLFEAFGIFLRRNPAIRPSIRLVLLGRQDAEVLKTRELAAIIDCVTLIPPVSHIRAIEYALGADILLFSVPNRSIIPSKIYEYVRTGNPIIGAAEPDSDSVTEANSLLPGSCRASRNPTKIAQFMESLLDSQIRKPERADLTRVTRRVLASQLAALLDKATKPA